MKQVRWAGHRTRIAGSRMKVILLIAVMLTSAIVVDSYILGTSRNRRRRNTRRRALLKKGENLLEILRDAADMKELLVEAESHAALGLMEEFQDLDGSNGDTFEKKVATLEEAAAGLKEDVKEVEEEAALGLVEEELKDLEGEVMTYESYFADSCHVGIDHHGRVVRSQLGEKEKETKQERIFSISGTGIIAFSMSLNNMILHCKNGKIIDSSYFEVNVNILYTSTGEPMQSATFEKKVAALEEADAELEEDVKEMEEDAALGLVEEELEELEEELEEVNNGLKE
uniref:Uncharacterized protein n=1 Tax=Branchiostoma floridae TaxID=7739 RepID=C3XVE6_BRAFL|eukprot:XP_002612063.1 hypothetical protein BRAFLDRAFT_94153 [Branchiostoma floridae]